MLARLLTIGAYPLTDATEARYGEIARKMLETGQWVVPQIDYGVPFWGKPPLSIWLTAISFRLLGVTEFAARISSLLLGVGVCSLVYVLGSRRGGVDQGLRASVVLATSLLMIVSAGSVMTDPAMLAGTTLSMVSFWLAMSAAPRRWGYIFFLGLAIGLLAKGPVATVLTLAPIGVWAVLTGRIRHMWRQLPWGAGTLLTMLLVVPWYWAAEVQSPGFLDYFLMGEHWQRFTVSGWTGDLYGSGHPHPRGTIWLYAVLGTLPWSPWLLWQLAGQKLARLNPAPQESTLPCLTIPITQSGSNDGWTLYLVCWMFAPLMFFTFSANILPTYVLPGLVGFALLVADAWGRQQSRALTRAPKWLGMLAPVLVLLLVRVAWPLSGIQSQREIVATYRNAVQRETPLLYFKRRPHSAQFYSGGSARDIDDIQELREVLETSTHIYVATRHSAYAALPDDLRARLAVVTTSDAGQYVLLREIAQPGKPDATTAEASLIRHL